MNLRRVGVEDIDTEPGALSSALEFLGKAFYAVEAPVRGTIAGAAGRNPKGGIAPLSGEEFFTAMGGPPNTPGKLEWRDVGEFLTETAVSPLTYLGGGLLTKGGKAAKEATKLAATRGGEKAAAKAIRAAGAGESALGRSVESAFRSKAAENAKRLRELLKETGGAKYGDTLAEQGSRAANQRSLLSLDIPFTRANVPLHPFGGRVSEQVFKGLTAAGQLPGVKQTRSFLRQKFIPRPPTTAGEAIRQQLLLGGRGAATTAEEWLEQTMRQADRPGVDLDAVLGALEKRDVPEKLQARLSEVLGRLEQRAEGRTGRELGAIKGAMTRAEKKYNAAIDEAVRVWDAAGHDGQRLATQIGEDLDFIQRLGSEAGVRSPKLKDDFLSYASRQTTPEGRVWTQTRPGVLDRHMDFIRVVSPTGNYQRRRSTGLLGRQIAQINEFMRRPKLTLEGDRYLRGLSGKSRKEAKKILSGEGEFSRYVDVNDTEAALRALDDGSQSFTAKLVEKGFDGNFFDPNPLTATTARIERGMKDIEAVRWGQSLLDNFAAPAEELIGQGVKQSSHFPVTKLLAGLPTGKWGRAAWKVGATPEQIEAALKAAGETRLYIPKEIAEEVLAHVQREPQAVQDILKFWDTIQAYHMGMLTSITLGPTVRKIGEHPLALTGIGGAVGALGGPATAAIGAGVGAGVGLAAKGIDRLARMSPAVAKLYDRIPMFAQYHVRNFVSNLYLSAHDGGIAGTMAKLQEAMRIVFKDKTAYREMRRLGVSQTGSKVAEAVSLARGAVGTKTFMDEGFEVAQKIEDVVRVAHYLKMKAAGLSDAEAAASVRKFLYDRDLTPFERDYVRRIGFFYNWTRKNLPHQIEMALTRPRYPSTSLRAAGLTGEAPEEQPWWARGAGMLNIPLSEGKTAQFQTGLPIFDLGNLGTQGQGIGRALTRLTGMASPALRVPAELATGREVFRGTDLVNLDAAPNWIRRLPEPVKQLIGAREVERADGSKYMRMSARLLHLTRSLPTGRLQRTVERIGEYYDESPNPIGDAFISWAFGRWITKDDDATALSNKMKVIDQRLSEMTEQGRARKLSIYGTRRGNEGDAELERLLKTRGALLKEYRK